MSEIDMSLLPDFILEAREHLAEMESTLLLLVGDRDNLELYNDLFRPVHTIKGGAQYIGLEKISALSHRLEDMLDLLREGNMQSSSQIIETLISARDRIALLVEELSNSSTEISAVDDLMATLSDMMGVGTDEGTEAPSYESPESDHTSSWGVYQEDSDEELFGIFLGHLKENCQELFSISHELPQSDRKASLLTRALEIIESLRSSANYMDYEELVGHYRLWMDAIESAISSIDLGTSPSLDFMAHNIELLKGSFHQLNEIETPEFAEFPKTEQSGILPEEPASGDVTDSVLQAFANMEQTEPEEPGQFAGDSGELPASDAEDVTDSVMQAFASMGGDDDSEQPPTMDEAEAEATSDIDHTLLPDFIIEAEEHLEEMESMLLQLVSEPENIALLNDIFRPIHTIKGGAQYIGLDKVSRLAHRLEDLLDLLREGQKPSSAEIVDILISARDRIALLVKELSSTRNEQTSVDDLVNTLSNIIEGKDVTQESETISTPQPDITHEEKDAGICQYNEEDDEELFAIFIEHLKERYAELSAITQNLARSDDKRGLLNTALEAIDALRSSANYMDYTELVQRYLTWGNQISQAISNLTQDIEADLSFMGEGLNDLKFYFPQLTGLGATDITTEDKSSVKVVVNKPVVGGLEDTLTKKETPARSASVEAATPSKELFDNLSNALDTSLNLGSAESDYRNLEEIFEELVSKGTDTAAAPKEPTEKKEDISVAKQAESKAEKDRKARQMEAKIKKSVRVDADKIDALMNQVGELVVDRSYFFQLFNEMRNLQRHLKETLGLEQKEVKLLRTFTYRLSEAIAALGRTSNELQEGVMKMRMLPISQIFNRYPRLVHDLTRNSDKQVNLVVKGEDTELDRMIVEELSDPLIHIIRNAIDHGIETTEERLNTGKSEKGTLILEAYQESNHIVIEVTDDGRGIDPDKIRTKALEKGLYSYDELERLGTDELIPLILTAGFSTASKITGTSGRGVGMDVVKKNIEKLNGTLEIDSKKGVGTQMRLRIPLTLAIIHALMVRVSGDLFTIPLANVDETVRIFEHDTSIVEGVEVIHLRGQTLPIFRLSTLFDAKKSASQSDKSFVVIVSVGGQRTGFVVDELLGQEEVVIKPLADYVQEKSGFSGATIIGDGRISLILDVYELVRMTTNLQAKKHQQQTEELKSRIRRRDNTEKQDV